MSLLRSPLLSDAGFAHAFPERSDDDAALLAALGVPSIAQVKQVHGGRCVDAREALSGPTEADAIVARAGGAPSAIGVRVADCVPVLLASAAGDVAVIHAGWRGVVGGVLAAGVAALSGDGDRGTLLAAVGPCIGPCCFEVGDDVAAAIAASCGSAKDVVHPSGAGRTKPHVNLRAAVRAQLVAAGLRGERIDGVPGCTRHEAARFHSFRRDGAGSGRMLAAIVTKPLG
jgi:YfiH family protein